MHDHGYGVYSYVMHDHAGMLQTPGWSPWCCHGVSPVTSHAGTTQTACPHPHAGTMQTACSPSLGSRCFQSAWMVTLCQGCYHARGDILPEVIFCQGYDGDIVPGVSVQSIMPTRAPHHWHGPHATESCCMCVESMYTLVRLRQ